MTAPVSRAGLPAALVVLLGGALATAAARVGVVRSFDDSAPGRTLAAAALVLLPGLVAVAVTVVRPALGSWVTAAAGLLALARTCADVGVLADPDGVVRPELYFETTLRAHPFRVGPGAVVLLLGDLVMVAGGAWAAAGRVGRDPEDPPRRAVGVLAAGLTGAVLAGAAALLQSYRGGFLDNWLLPPALGGWSLGAALLWVALPAGAVLVAAALPRPAAVAVTAGAGVAVVAWALVPLVVAGVGRTGLQVTIAPWLGVLGGLLVAGAGGAGPRGSAVRARDAAGRRAADLVERWAGPAAAGLALLAAVGAALAAWRPGLLVDGRPDAAGDWALAPDRVYSAPIGPPFLWAAVLLAVGAVVAAVPRAARAGRTMLLAAWSLPAYAVAQGLARYSEISAVVPNDVQATALTARTWSVGPGLWWGTAATVLAVPAAVLAGLARRRDAEDADPPEARLVDPAAAYARDDAEADRRSRRLILAGVVGLATLVAGFLPAFTSADRNGPALGSLALDGVGTWALVAGVVLLVWSAATDPAPLVVVAAVVAALDIAAVRLLLPVGLPGLRIGPGWAATLVVLVLLVVDGVLVGTWLRPVPEPALVAAVRRSPRSSARPAGKPVRRR